MRTLVMFYSASATASGHANAVERFAAEFANDLRAGLDVGD